jgi:hypothetical protein
MRITLLLLLLTSHCFAQYKSTFLHAKMSVGGSLNSTQIANTNVADHLIGFDTKVSSVQFLSITFFIKNKWGIDLSHQRLTSDKIQTRTQSFNTELTNLYNNRFYVNPGNTEEYNDPRYERTVIGLLYKFEHNKWMIIPGIRVGSITIPVDRTNGTLKEINGNKIYELDFVSDNSSDKAIATGLSCNIAYRIFKNFAFHLEGSYYYVKPDFTITETLTDLYLKQSTETTHHYTTPIHMFGIEAGLMFILPTSTPKTK